MTDKEPHRLVRELYALAARDDRAALAQLRRSLSEGNEALAYPYVARFFGPKEDRRSEKILLLVAGLFALHPRHGSRSLAAALRHCKEMRRSESIEGRFVALLNAHPDDLGEHLRHVISLVRADDVAIDWDDLLEKLLRWNWESSHRAWAREFWAHHESDKEQETAP